MMAIVSGAADPCPSSLLLSWQREEDSPVTSCGTAVPRSHEGVAQSRQATHTFPTGTATTTVSARNWAVAMALSAALPDDDDDCTINFLLKCGIQAAMAEAAAEAQVRNLAAAGQLQSSLTGPAVATAISSSCEVRMPVKCRGRRHHPQLQPQNTWQLPSNHLTAESSGQQVKMTGAADRASTWPACCALSIGRIMFSRRCGTIICPATPPLLAVRSPRALAKAASSSSSPIASRLGMSSEYR